LPNDFSDKWIDERSYIEEVVGQGGIDHEYVHAPEYTPLYDVGQVVSSFGQPHFHPNSFLYRVTQRKAADAGIRVLLDGQDGDTVVSHGLHRLDELARENEWDTFVSESLAVTQKYESRPGSALDHAEVALRRLAQSGRWWTLGRAITRLSSGLNVPAWTLVRRFGIKPVIPSAVLALWRRIWREESNASSGLVKNRFVGQFQDWSSEIDTEESHHTTHIEGVQSGIWQWSMEFANALCADLALEERYPFFDRRVIEYCVSLPSHLKLRQGWTRYILRLAMDGTLPNDVQWRSGKGRLGGGFIYGMYKERRKIEQIVHQEDRSLESFLNLGQIHSALESFTADPTDSGWAAERLFRVLLFHEWLSQRQDGL
jgi:asparagine synthase (glutamine-hydrolysing)